MKSFCFISVMGTQIMGTINPLLALLENNISISSVHLLVSQKVLEVGTHFEEFCRNQGIKTHIDFIAMPPHVHADLPQAREAILDIAQKAADRGETCIFNINGSTNQMIAQCSLALTPFNTAFIQATNTHILFHTEGSLRYLAAPKALSVKDIFHLQGINAEFSSEPPQYTTKEFCQKGNMPMPTGHLANVHMDGIDFDLIWGMPNNRLSFLVSFLNYEEDKAKRLERIRTLCHWANSRNSGNHLFDRTVYVIAADANALEHLQSEGGAKITILPVEDWKKYPMILREALQKAFTMPPQATAQPLTPKKRKAVPVAANSLITIMGKNPSPTLLTIHSHIRAQNIRHLILCHTDDLRDQATRVRDMQENLGLESVRLIPCKIDGSDLPACFAAPEDAQHVHVNITPGTKGQGVYLALWAQKHDCMAWAVQQETQNILPIYNTKKITDYDVIPLWATDPLTLLTLREEHYECATEEQAATKTRNTALLHFLHAALNDTRSDWVFRQALKIDNVATLHRPSLKDWELIMPDGTRHAFSEEGGEWLELLTTEAFRKAGAHYTHSRVRVLRSEERIVNIRQQYGEDAETFLSDTDVIGAFEGNNFLVSCKANPHADIDATAKEARSMSTLIDRYTLPFVCLSFCEKAYYNAKNRVTIIGWRELCQPDVIRSLLIEARNKTK